MTGPNWFALELVEVLNRLNTSENGLTTAEAQLRQTQWGANVIPEGQRRTLLKIVFNQFADFMILILLFAALISGFVGEIQDTIAILVIILLNAVIGTVQEYRAEGAVAALREMAAPQAQVLRDGAIVNISSSELIPGDIVLLEAGNKVPADIRLLTTEELQADESALTGESQPVQKHAEILRDAELMLGDRSNCAFKSSLITRGRGSGVVVATGLNTEIGNIALLLRDEPDVKTPLQVRLTVFGRYLALSVIAICGVIFVAGLLQGQPLLLMFLTSVSLAVAAIPEALPAVIAISLAFGAHKLIKRRALVRNLPAVETLGSVTYICTDKTGTLTENKMTAEVFSVGSETRQLLPNIDKSQGSWKELTHCLALNNDIADINQEASGEPTELALFEAARKAGFYKRELGKALPRVTAIPFDSDRKLMTTLHRISHDNRDTGYVAYTKGAPEQVLKNCRSVFNDSNAIFDPVSILRQAEKLASDGYRVLAMAMRLFPKQTEQIATEAMESELSFLGLVALIDPPRPEVSQAVADCRAAGIRPVMITGDHPGTATAIARRLGFIDDTDGVVTGEELASLSDTAFEEKVSSIKVYARVSPQQKLRIVKALQNRSEFVAMTGDGVNDAPALKRANIGVAMGINGTDVAREASDMVLMDDNFATIVNAVREGRHVFENIRKFIKYTMSSNSGEIWTLFLAPLFGLPIPLLPIHILWINLATDGLPGLAFAAEPSERGIMHRPPRPTNESIFSHGMWQYILWVGLLIGLLSVASQAWAIYRGVEYWQTIVFTLLTVSQLFHSMAVRSEHESLFSIGLMSNFAMFGTVVLSIGAQLLIIYVPVFNKVFHTQPLPLFDLIMCFMLASVVLWVVEIKKWFLRRNIRLA